MAANLGVADAARLARVADAQAVRVNYYPACPHGRGRVLGLSPHSDAAGLTLLLQVSAVPGLQIRRRGAWISVDPIPGALVANVGDVVEVLTNGRYKSIEHRALVSPTHHRVSVAAFHSARFGDTYAPLEETIVDGDEPARYRSIGVEDYVRLVLSSKLQGKNIMDAMKINPVTE
jgi:isopenicillin N synthase-like dioxygenase